MSTLKGWVQEHYDEDQLRDLYTHGAAAGFPGITYYRHTNQLYDKYADEIWDRLSDQAVAFGYANPIKLVASFNGANNVWNEAQWKNLLVWWYVEETAAQLVEGGS